MLYEVITREMADDVGGKNANLGEMLGRLGLPVPAGFAVTTFAGRAFFEAAGIDAAVASLLLDLDIDAQEALVQRSEEIQSLVLKAELPADLAEALLVAHAALAAERGVRNNFV